MGLTLGIVGLGQIGSRMARFGLALEMRVVAYDPLLDHDGPPVHGVGHEQTLDALLGVSNVVSLHTPLTASMYRLIASGLPGRSPGRSSSTPRAAASSAENVERIGLGLEPL
jgi:phosphoglycerate dehydrogenase-like enzyme